MRDFIKCLFKISIDNIHLSTLFQTLHICPRVTLYRVSHFAALRAFVYKEFPTLPFGHVRFVMLVMSKEGRAVEVVPGI